MGDEPAQAARIAVWIALLGLVITTAVTLWLVDRANQHAEAAIANEGEQLVASTQVTLDGVFERLISVGGLFRASDEVTEVEFRRFVESYDPITGMGGLGYMAVVAADDLARFTNEIGDTIPGYEVFELGELGRRIAVAPRQEYFPVQWFEPADAFGKPHGFDSGSESRRLATLERARATRGIAATPFLQLVSEEEADGFMVYWPVVDPVSDTVIGFTLAPMDLSELIDGHTSANLLANLSWGIVDTTDDPLIDVVSGSRWTESFEVGGRRWSLTAEPKDGGSLFADRTEAWLVLFAGLGASIIAAAGMYMYRQRSRTRMELDQLRELARAKDQFLASVSHELRTPLTGVLGFSEVLRDRVSELSADDSHSMISTIASEATDLACIIEDLLVAARSESDLLAVTRVPITPRAQVAQVLEAEGRHTSDQVELLGDADGTYRVIGDPGRVRQILRNLISNARRYGGDRIQIRFERSGGHGVISVADNGGGLPREEWERIFEPYYRVNDPDGQTAAVGIGLSVARQLAELMGGTLTYRAEDGWSVFEVALLAEPDADLVLASSAAVVRPSQSSPEDGATV